MQIAALKERERDLPQTLTISGVDYPCVASSYSHSKQIDVGGFELEADISFTVRRSLLPSVPSEQSTVTYSSSTFRILKVIESPGSAFIRLICVSANRGV